MLDDELARARARRGGEPPRVLDVGGGSGVHAVPLAVAGCVVTVVEPNPNALATLHRRAADAGVSDGITAVQADTDALAQVVAPGSADLVLAHGLLEVVDDAHDALVAMVDTLTADGAVSALVANRYSAVLHRAIAGRLGQARALLDDPDGRLAGEAVLRRFDVSSLETLLGAAGLRVELVQGSGALADLVPGAVLEATPGAAETLAGLELVAAVTPPLRDIATRLHALARKPAR